MSCKLELPKSDSKAESEIYLLNEFPNTLEDLHKKAKQKFGARLPDHFRLKYNQPNKDVRYITTEEDFKNLVNETKRFKLIIEGLPQDSGKSSTVVSEKQLEETEIVEEPIKVSKSEDKQDLSQQVVDAIEENKQAPLEEVIVDAPSEKIQTITTNNLVSKELLDEMITKKFEELFHTRLQTEMVKINEKIQALQSELNEMKGLNTQLIQIIKTHNLEHELKKSEGDLSASKAICSSCQASYSVDSSEANKDGKSLDVCKDCAGKAKLLESTKSNKLGKVSVAKAYKVQIVDVPAQTPALVPGAKYQISFSIKNAGVLTWAEDTTLECLSGCHAKESVYIGGKQPDQVHKLALDLTAPSQAGTAQSCWRLRYFDAESNQNKYFGPKFTFEVEVKQPESEKPQTIVVEDISKSFNCNIKAENH